VSTTWNTDGTADLTALIICDQTVSTSCEGLSAEGEFNFNEVDNTIEVHVRNTSNTLLSPEAYRELTGIAWEVASTVDVAMPDQGDVDGSGQTFHNGLTEAALDDFWGVRNDGGSDDSGPFFNPDITGDPTFNPNVTIATLGASVIGGHTFNDDGTNLIPTEVAIDGPNGGINSMDSPDPTALRSVEDSLWFTLELDGDGTDYISNIGTLYVSFGSPKAVPIPSTLLLFGAGFAGVVAWR